MRVSFIGIVFVFGYTMFQALMRGIGRTQLPLLIVLATVFLNFLLDPLFIFGWGPVPGSGVVGAAAATLITQGLAAVVGIVILLRGRDGIHLKRASLLPDFNYIRGAFWLGLPGSIDLSTRALGLIVMSFLVARFGTLSIAAYGVGSTIIQIVTVPAAGVSMALTTLVGQNLGADNTERAGTIARLAILCSFAVLSTVGIAAFSAAPLLVAAFVPSDPKLISAGAEFVRIMALTWGGIGIQFCVVAVLRASGQMFRAMVLALVSQWIIQFPLAYTLSVYLHLSIHGIWWSFAASNAAGAALSLGCLATGQWKRGRLMATVK